MYTYVHLQGTSLVNVELPVSVQLISLAAMHQTRARPSFVQPASCCVLGSMWSVLDGSGHMNWPIICSSLQSTFTWCVVLVPKIRRSSSGKRAQQHIGFS